MAVKPISTLRSDIIAAIANNNTGAITGNILQTQLVDLLDSLNALDASTITDANITSAASTPSGTITGAQARLAALLAVASEIPIPAAGTAIAKHPITDEILSGFYSRRVGGIGTIYSDFSISATYSAGGWAADYNTSPSGTIGNNVCASTGTGVLYLDSVVTGPNPNPKASRIVTVSKCKISKVSDSTDTYTLRMGRREGYQDDDIRSGPYLRYDKDTNGGCYQFVSRGASAATTVNSSIPHAADTIVTLVTDETPSSLTAWINGTKVADAISTNLVGFSGRSLVRYCPGISFARTAGTASITISTYDFWSLIIP